MLTKVDGGTDGDDANNPSAERPRVVTTSPQPKEISISALSKQGVENWCKYGLPPPLFWVIKQYVMAKFFFIGIGFNTVKPVYNNHPMEYLSAFRSSSMLPEAT